MFRIMVWCSNGNDWNEKSKQLSHNHHHHDDDERWTMTNNVDGLLIPGIGTKEKNRDLKSGIPLSSIVNVCSTLLLWWFRDYFFVLFWFFLKDSKIQAIIIITNASKDSYSIFRPLKFFHFFCSFVFIHFNLIHYFHFNHLCCIKNRSGKKDCRSSINNNKNDQKFKTNCMHVRHNDYGDENKRQKKARKFSLFFHIFAFFFLLEFILIQILFFFLSMGLLMLPCLEKSIN